MVLDTRWPITRFGQDLSRTYPQAIQNVGGAQVLTPALIKLPFAGSNLDGSEVIVTLGNYSPTATDVLIILNKTIAAATTITLPSVLGRSGVPYYYS
jgi:hypothetical protein